MTSLENLTLTDAELAACDPVDGEGGRVKRAFCPFHGSDHQRSLRVDLETGRFHCFACGAWGYMDWARERWRQEREKASPHAARGAGARRLLRKPPPKAARPARGGLPELLRAYQKALPGSPGEAYLRRRRIPLELARELGLGYAAPGKWAHKGRDWKRGRLVFPHHDPDGCLVNLYGRAVELDEEAPKHLRHDHLPGAKGYFNATALREGEGPVFVCEGPFDALALMAAGFPRAVAIFGVHGWRWDWARGVREMVLALDADATGQEAWKTLARHARLRGKQVAFLSPEAYGGRKDVAEAWEAGVLDVGPYPPRQESEAACEPAVAAVSEDKAQAVEGPLEEPLPVGEGLVVLDAPTDDEDPEWGPAEGACYACGHRDWWRRPGGPWTCAVCHPPAVAPVERVTRPVPLPPRPTRRAEPEPLAAPETPKGRVPRCQRCGAEVAHWSVTICQRCRDAEWLRPAPLAKEAKAS